jgi:hypothetical protein
VRAEGCVRSAAWRAAPILRFGQCRRSRRSELDVPLHAHPSQGRRGSLRDFRDTGAYRSELVRRSSEGNAHLFVLPRNVCMASGVASLSLAREHHILAHQPRARSPGSLTSTSSTRALSTTISAPPTALLPSALSCVRCSCTARVPGFRSRPSLPLLCARLYAVALPTMYC